MPIDLIELERALAAWARWYSARLSRINSGSNEDYTGHEQDLFEAIGCSTEPALPFREMSLLLAKD